MRHKIDITDEHGVLTEVEIEHIIPGRERNDLVVVYRRVSRAQHEHDVAVVEEIVVIGKPPGSKRFLQGAHAMKQVILRTLKAKADG